MEPNYYVVQLDYSNGMWSFRIEEVQPPGYVFSGTYAECVEYTNTWSY